MILCSKECDPCCDFCIHEEFFLGEKHVIGGPIGCLYHKDLEHCGISDPPAVSYNDFELANRWPYSIVASTFLYDNNPDDYFYEPEDKRTYRIVVNHEELFESKTGKMAD